ncbi:S41 family peptidase [Kallotenue papyrolyticum]|uniref:S41 family peptidase n=1 Tax=Kallotenue papyrolyticum TaxID=1325125 RepID=UPI0004B228BD|nr:S41 family peptidase [Kallotenue papyrolyticum]
MQTARHGWRHALRWSALALLVSGCTAPPPVPVAPQAVRAEATALPPTVTRAPLTPTPLPLPTATPAPTSAPRTPPPAPTATATPLPPPTAVTVLPTPTLPALDEAQRAAIFDRVWELIAAHYLYPDFGGVDWVAVGQRYRAAALQAPTTAAFYAQIKAMLGELGDQHSRFEQPQEVAWQEALANGAVAYVGIGIEQVPVDEGLLVTLVLPDGPAASAGVRPRDLIVAVDGRPARAHEAAIAGPEGTQVRLTLRDPEGRQREVLVERRAVAFRYRPEARLLPRTRFGYVRIPSFWAEDMDEQTVAALRDLLRASDGRLRGLILDLRGNGGGWRSVVQGLLSQFVAGNVGQFYTQRDAYSFTVEPGELYVELRALPLVVLVDRDTESYAEIFAAVLQASGRARVIGINTAGNTETIFAYDLDDGSRVWIAQEGFRLPDGTNLEGRGVIPDRSIVVDWARFSEARDPHLLAAIQALRFWPAAEPQGAGDAP